MKWHKSPPPPAHTTIGVQSKRGSTELVLVHELELEKNQVGWVLRSNVIIMMFRVLRSHGKFLDIAPHKWTKETGYRKGDTVVFGPVLHESEMEVVA